MTNQDHRIPSYSANCSYGARIQYGGRSLTFQFFTNITHSTRNLKKNKPRAQIKPKDFQVLKRNDRLAKKLLWLSVQSCVYTWSAESNIVNFPINKTGTDTASWRHKITRLPAVLLLPSHSIFHLQVCAGSCPQGCHEPRDLLTQHKTRLPISRARITAGAGITKELPIFHHQASSACPYKTVSLILLQESDLSPFTGTAKAPWLWSMTEHSLLIPSTGFLLQPPVSPLRKLESSWSFRFCCMHN